MTLESRAAELLALIDTYRVARCGAILEAARERTARARREAATGARERPAEARSMKRGELRADVHAREPR